MPKTPKAPEDCKVIFDQGGDYLKHHDKTFWVKKGRHVLVIKEDEITENMGGIRYAWVKTILEMLNEGVYERVPYHGDLMELDAAKDIVCNIEYALCPHKDERVKYFVAEVKSEYFYLTKNNQLLEQDAEHGINDCSWGYEEGILVSLGDAKRVVDALKFNN